MLYYAQIIIHKEGYIMEHIKTLNTKNLQNTVKKAAAVSVRHLASQHAKLPVL